MMATPSSHHRDAVAGLRGSRGERTSGYYVLSITAKNRDNAIFFL